MKVEQNKLQSEFANLKSCKKNFIDKTNYLSGQIKQLNDNMIETPKQLLNENERLSKAIQQSAKQFQILTSKKMDLELNVQRSIEVVNKVNTICVYVDETDKI